MRLSKFDKTAADPGAPFGGGVSSMGGGGSGSTGQAQEASPNHQGPPPAAAGSSQVHHCAECGYVAHDGGDLDEHMRKEHFVRGTFGRATGSAAVPAALIFIDSLGDTLPFKSSFTFKELSDFCLREGVNVLTDMTEGDLFSIAKHIAELTNNHVRIDPQPTVAENRSPLSAVDLSIAGKTGEVKKACRECGVPVPAYRFFCDACHGDHTEKKVALYAFVTLKDGSAYHVVEMVGSTIVGVDDSFDSREFISSDIATIHNMDDALRTIRAARCNMCGEDVFELAPKCGTCGAHR